MDLKCKLVEKSFKDSEGLKHSYYVLSFDLADDSTLEVNIKGDKAKILKLSTNVDNKNSNNDFWSNVDK